MIPSRPTSTWRTPTVVLVSCGIIMTLAMGIRHGFGLYLQPISTDMHWGRETFALAPSRISSGASRSRSPA